MIRMGNLDIFLSKTSARQFKGAGNTLRPCFIMWATVGSVTGNKS